MQFCTHCQRMWLLQLCEMRADSSTANTKAQTPWPFDRELHYKTHTWQTQCIMSLLFPVLLNKTQLTTCCHCFHQQLQRELCCLSCCCCCLHQLNDGHFCCISPAQVHLRLDACVAAVAVTVPLRRSSKQVGHNLLVKHKRQRLNRDAKTAAVCGKRQHARTKLAVLHGARQCTATLPVS